MKLIDTSAWVEYLRSKDSPVYEQVRAMMVAGEAAWCGIIALELANSDRPQDAAKLQKARKMAWMVETDEHVWLTACKLASAARRRAVTAPLPDYVIFVCSKLYNLELFHTGDKDFSRLETVFAQI